MSVFQRVYVWLDSLSDSQMVCWPHDIAEEFLAVVLHLPVAHTDIRVFVSSVVLCTDATLVHADTKVHKGDVFTNDMSPKDFAQKLQMMRVAPRTSQSK